MHQANVSRYETMKYNRCGKSGLKLPEVSLGLCTILEALLFMKT